MSAPQNPPLMSIMNSPLLRQQQEKTAEQTPEQTLPPTTPPVASAPAAVSPAAVNASAAGAVGLAPYGFDPAGPTPPLVPMLRLCRFLLCLCLLVFRQLCRLVRRLLSLLLVCLLRVSL